MSEERVGQWVSFYRLGRTVVWRCTACGERLVDACVGEPPFGYCPHCGAKMLGVLGDVPETVPVTRCRDCRFYGTKYGRCGIFGCDKEEDGYCDEAIRRET